MISRINVVDPNLKNRAKLSRELIPICEHIEVFEGIEDFKSYLPKDGIVLLNNGAIRVEELFESLRTICKWFPVVAYDEDITPGRVVDAIASGAIDFLSWPIEAPQLEARAARIEKQRETIGDQMIAQYNAKAMIADLSPRESEVLEALANGNSNKGIARILNLSPRTVEIHRANMMGKLRASHAAEAVRIAADAGLTNPTIDPAGQATQLVNRPEALLGTTRHIMQ